MMCGNINKDVRSKLTSRCWVKVAEIPVAKFLEKEHNGILNKCLYHACMNIVTETLKECSHNPIFMPDAEAIMRLVRTILLSHIADNEEQTMIACVSTRASPITLARFHELGLAERQSLRTRAITLECIRSLLTFSHPQNISRYARKARSMGMNSVYMPYWRRWKFADPCKFLTPDALHQWHIFFLETSYDVGEGAYRRLRN